MKLSIGTRVGTMGGPSSQSELSWKAESLSSSWTLTLAHGLHISGVIRDPAPKGNFCNADILGEKAACPHSLSGSRDSRAKKRSFCGRQGEMGKLLWRWDFGDQEETGFVWAVWAVNGWVTLYNGNCPGLEERRRALSAEDCCHERSPRTAAHTLNLTL